MKKIRIYLSLMISLLMGNDLFAQHAHFIQNGIIEFEKKSNMYALIKKRIKDDDNQWMNQAFDSYKKNNSQFKTAKSVLSFNKTKSLYTWPNSDEPANNNWIANDPLATLKNTIFTNFDTQKSTTKKDVFENIYLVTDSVRNIKWKITDETREIAGFECRRANALIMDSIYVVAFYTNEIAVSGGPESFTGLPGMILGIALPHENVTWFATKITEVAVQEKDLLAPTKGKPIDNKGLQTVLRGAMKDWGEYAQFILKAFLL